MSVTLFRRPSRLKPPAMPSGELTLQEPPVLTEPNNNSFGGMLMYLPMMIGSGAMMMMFMGNRGGLGLIVMAVMAVGMLTMGLFMATRGSGEQRKKMRGERRDFLRYMSQVRKQVRETAQEQRAALTWRHPDPAGLWSTALSARLWERRASHPDFAEIRIARCAQPLAMTISPLQTKPVEDLEPLCARALRRFIRAYTTVDDLPTAIFLRGFAQVQLRGDADTGRALARAMLAQLITFHSPDDLRIVVATSKDHLEQWDWVKWLPHNQHASAQDGAGHRRLFAQSLAGIEEMFTESLNERARFEAGTSPTKEEPYVVIIVDDISLPTESRLCGAGYRNAVVLNVCGGMPFTANRNKLRMDISSDQIDMIRNDRSGNEVRTPIGRADTLTIEEAKSLAKTISPLRLVATADVAEPMVTDFDLGVLLGVGEMGELDPADVWNRRATADRLRVPIGIAEDGTKLELDIKESAQGGMGPHGLLIGATGSGKSELLRTLVLALAITHSSDTLNFVLVDFKGGATFLGLDKLPHISATITNLANEATLVTRMQDALHGEIVRRQELLRQAGNYSSVLEYEKARLDGAPLDPLPTLFVIVDEFSELLSTHPDFAELFVMIGRLGRSLAVHLLLASQRLEDGRMHKLESHLSYRVGLRTFSAMESRSVIGVPDAYQLPNAPGNGYLRSDVATLTRFKAAYVSGTYRRRTAKQRQEAVRRQVVSFRAAEQPLPQLIAEPALVPQPHDTSAAPGDGEDAESVEATETLLEVAVSRLQDKGPPAHQVWLPPLVEPPTLDQVLPPLEPDPVFGLTPASWPGRGKLIVPVGVIDKPFEQVRDLLMADLSGVGGHVGIAGGPQAGKSTILRTLITSLALTHTPLEVQFYCLDFGGGTLGALSELPHVGGVAGRMDAQKVSRTVAEVHSVLAERERQFARLGVESMAAYRQMRRDGEVTDDPFGDVFLIVDGWSSVRADFEEHDQPIRDLAARGLTFGVHVVITTARWSDVHSALRDQLGTRIELRLGDPIDSMIDMRAADQVPQIPGRGMTPDKLHFLGAVPRIDGNQQADDLTPAVRALAESVTESWPGKQAPVVRMLPSLLPVSELPAPEGQMKVPLGIAESDLQPVWHDFSTQPHLTVLGDSECGKSALLRLIAQAIPQCYRPSEAQVIAVDTRRALMEHIPKEYLRGFAFAAEAAGTLAQAAGEELRARLPGPDITPAELQERAWWSGPEIYLLIDDYDLLTGSMGGPFDSLVDLLPQAADIGLHVVLTRGAAGSSRLSMDSVVRRMQEANTPDLVYSVPPTEMPLLNGMRPRQLPTGRANLVTRRNATLLQVAWPDATTSAGARS